jgi:hypothetical protein
MDLGLFFIQVAYDGYAKSGGLAQWIAHPCIIYPPFCGLLSPMKLVYTTSFELFIQIDSTYIVLVSTIMFTSIDHTNVAPLATCGLTVHSCMSHLHKVFIDFFLLPRLSFLFLLVSSHTTKLPIVDCVSS